MRLKSKTEPMVRSFILVYIIRIIGNKEFRKRGEGCFRFVSLLNIFNGLMIGTIFA
jgi:hypothetical protein